MSSNAAIVVCQSGYEGLLAREMEGLGLSASESGPGWVRTESAAGLSTDGLRQAAFPHAILEGTVAMSGDRVNELAQAIFEFFAGRVRGERIEGAWPCLFAGGQDVTGLGRRVAAVESAFHELLKKKLGRVAKLASADLEVLEGFFARRLDMSMETRGALAQRIASAIQAKSGLQIPEGASIETFLEATARQLRDLARMK